MNREYRVRSVIMRWVIIYDRVHTIIVKTLEVSSLLVSELPGWSQYHEEK